MSILKYEDVVKITQFLHDNGYDGYPIVIENKVRTKAILDKVNEEYFYRSNPDTEATPDQCDEVNINVNGYTFKYTVSEDAENSEEDTH